MDQIPSISTIIALIVGGFLGWVAARLSKRHFFGEILYAVIGMVGGFVGAWIWTFVYPPGADITAWLHAAAAAAVGSIVLLAVWRLARR
jgi:uncharacterized membrane protein YeaQ/YmgE (transglycosylase-associated protein family)